MNSTFSPDNPLNLTAALLMIANGSFGIVCNFLIVYIFIRSPTERTSFNLICFIRAIGNCLILGWAFLGTFVPMTVLGDFLFSPTYQSIVITSVNSTYTGLQYSGILIAINRFFAMYFPQFYSKVFNIQFTLLQLVILFTYRIVKIVTECNWNIPNHCYQVYSSEYLCWIPLTEPICQKVESSLMIDATAVLLGALILINSATFIRIYFFFKSTKIEENEMKRKVKKNKILFVQTILQDVTYFIDMLFTYKLSTLIDERYWTFISGSFVWQSVHSFDGLIMIMFNERLTFLKKTFFSSSSHPSVAHTTKQTVSVAHSRSVPVPVD